jgi:hypothetical protein
MKILICGSRNKVNEAQICRWLDNMYSSEKGVEIIEGCCANSADAVAERWAIKNNVKVHHHPAIPGKYLKRNIQMVEECDMVYAFWDGFSYGTAQTIAQAVRLNKPVKVISYKVEGNNEKKQ